MRIIIRSQMKVLSKENVNIKGKEKNNAKQLEGTKCHVILCQQ